VTVGADASLNMLRIVRRRKRGDFHVCCELEHLPFKDGLFGTVITCRVLQHIRAQDVAVSEMARVTRSKGNLMVEVYNSWNLKALYKNIRMSPRLRGILNLPFRPFVKDRLPFGDWGLTYDRYNSWLELRRWLGRSGMKPNGGRGAGFGYHRYILHRSFVEMLLMRRSRLITAYYNACFHVEKLIGGLPPFRYFLEKIIVKGTRD